MGQQGYRPLFSRTPWRQLYKSYRVVSALIRFPVWIISSAIPYTRLHPGWTFKQSLTLYICHDMVDAEACVGLTEDLTLDPGRDGDRFEAIQPFPTESYQGALSSPFVSPVEVGGVWFPETPTAIDPKDIFVLLIHGGAFVSGDGRSSSYSHVADNLIKYAQARAVLSVQYRLSGYGGRNPFPAALQDVLTAYLYMTQTLKIPPTSIVIAGNSSGANLVVAFVRYLEQVTPNFGRPLCAAAMSPWVAPLETAAPDYTRTKDYTTEYVAESFHQWGAKTYTPPEGVSESTEPYITLLGHPFPTSVPILTTFGECEALAADIAAWTEEMRAIPGNSIEVHCEAKGIHASIFVGNRLGWDDSARDTSARIGELVQAARNSLASRGSVEH
jgi:acetyl esterase/lipase